MECNIHVIAWAWFGCNSNEHGTISTRCRVIAWAWFGCNLSTKWRPAAAMRRHRLGMVWLQHANARRYLITCIVIAWAWFGCNNTAPNEALAQKGGHRLGMVWLQHTRTYRRTLRATKSSLGHGLVATWKNAAAPITTTPTSSLGHGLVATL